jgi:hypothetical protein
MPTYLGDDWFAGKYGDERRKQKEYAVDIGILL